ncbi:hypothetical protein ACFL2T_07550 [Elusimicrobiota bacterium]
MNAPTTQVILLAAALALPACCFAAPDDPPEILEAGAIRTDGGYSPDTGLVDGWSAEGEGSVPFPPPYTARYDDGRAALSFVAARHGRDMHTFFLIDKEINEFRPRVIIIEGLATAEGLSSQKWLRKMDEHRLWDEAEPCFATKLAVAYGIPFMGGEPTPVELKDGMAESRFSLKDFQGFYIIRTLTARPKQPDFSAAFAKVVSEFRQEFRIEDGSGLFSEPGFLDWYRKKNGKEFDYASIAQHEVFPRSGRKALHSQKVSMATSMFRNRHLAAVIAAMLDSYGRVLIVYGAGHHIELKRVLDGMLGEPQTYINP